MGLEIQKQFVLIVILTVFIVVTYFVSINLKESNNLPLKISEFISWQSVVVSETPLNGNEHEILTPNVEQIPGIELFPKVFERFNSRKQLLKERCELLDMTENYVYYDFFLNERMLYEKYHDFFVCLVAKNAASTWWQHLNNVGLKRNRTENAVDLSKREKEKKVLSADTVKVLTVRNPIDRLTSAYSDKFGDGREELHRETSKQWYDYAEGILHVSLGGHRNRSISFGQYINVIKNEPAKLDRHFRSVYSNCVPCKIDYDFIVHQETFSEDLSYLFHVLNITESTVDVHVNESGNKTIGKKPSELYLKDLNTDQLAAIYDLLWIDFFLFDYPLPNSIVKAHKEHGSKSFS